MTNGAYISEIFSSVQGEGRYIGYRQVFIRFSGCVFDCPYCDTDFSAGDEFDIEGKVLRNPAEPGMLAEEILAAYEPEFIHSYSFTGGEPLLAPDFIEECAGIIKTRSGRKLFLETSGLITDLIPRFDGLFDIMSVDIKTHSEKAVKNIPVLFRTLTGLKESEYYLKLLLPENFSQELLETIAGLMVSCGIKDIIVQPVDNRISGGGISEVFRTFYRRGIEARIIPQSHKLLNVR